MALFVPQGVLITRHEVGERDVVVSGSEFAECPLCNGFDVDFTIEAIPVAQSTLTLAKPAEGVNSMPWTDERWAALALRGMFDALAQIIGQCLEKTSDDDPALPKLQTIESTVSNMTARVAASDPALVSISAISDLERAASEIQNHLSTYRDSGEAANLDEAFLSADGLIQAGGSLPVLVPLTTAANTASLRQAINRFSSQLADAQAKLADVEKEAREAALHATAAMAEAGQVAVARIGEEEDRITAKTSELESGILARSTEFESAAKNTEARMAEQVNRIDEQVSREGQQFQDREQARQEEFTRGESTRFQSFKEATDAQDVSGSRLIASLQDLEDRGQEILGITTARATAEAYMNEANAQQREANRWRRIGIAAVIGTVVVATGAVLLFQPGSNAPVGEWVRAYLFRTPIVAGVVALATYALAQAGHHRRREQVARRMQNELTTFRPFIVELDKSDRDDLVKQASIRFFPGHDLIDERPKAPATPTAKT